MKNLKAFIAITVLVTIITANKTIAQTNNNTIINDSVKSAFAVKYPKAQIKKWQVINNQIVAEAKENRAKFYATFDKNNKWVETTSKINWSWNLPAEVKNALKSSKYASWRVDKLKKVETPFGEFFQVLVDNVYQQVDADHAGFAENIVLNFKPNGEIMDKKSISSPLLF